MTDHRDWTGKVGNTWAREWRRTDRSFRELTPHLLAAAGAARFDRVLDIGCGAGETFCSLASHNPEPQVLGLDISSELVAVAEERAASLGNCAFRVADAAHADLSGFAPDLLVSRHGVMFFTDPPAAFAHLAMQAARGARLAFSCFRARSENAWVAATLAALPEAPPPTDPHAPGPFAFADADRVATILEQGGWRDVAFEPIDYRNVIGEGDDPVADARDYLTRIGPTASALAQLDPAARVFALDRLSAILEGYLDGTTVSLPAAAWIVTARAA